MYLVWRLIVLSTVLAGLTACQPRNPLPADWPITGLGLPGSAQTAPLPDFLQGSSSDGVYASQFGEREDLYMVCFNCRGGIGMARVHFGRELRGRGFTEVPQDDYLEQHAGGMDVSHEMYFYLSADKLVGVCIERIREPGLDAPRSDVGELLLIISVAKQQR